jgi:hypothetical protein
VRAAKVPRVLPVPCRLPVSYVLAVPCMLPRPGGRFWRHDRSEAAPPESKEERPKRRKHDRREGSTTEAKEARQKEAPTKWRGGGGVEDGNRDDENRDHGRGEGSTTEGRKHD